MLTVLYLVFNEGYTATGGDSLIRADLCEEAIRLARLLAELMPDEPEVHGLLALMLLIESRRPTRTAPDGTMVLLADQDRSLWDRELIDEGQAIVRALLRRNTPGPFQIQAAINAVHSDAPVAALTDWSQIVELYDMLLTHHADADRRAQPRRRGRRGGRPGGRARRSRRARPVAVPPVPRDPWRAAGPAAPAG